MVPDARHMEASVVDPELYWNTVNAFIKTRIRIVSHENCVKVHMRFSSCLSPR